MTELEKAKRLWGVEIPWLGSLKDTLEHNTFDTVQTTLGGPSAGINQIPTISSNDRPVKFPKTLLFHASHQVHLASEKNYAGNLLQRTLNQVSHIDTKTGVVAHVGSGSGGLERVVEQVNRLTLPDNVTLYLENAAGMGAHLGKSVRELAEVFDNIPKKVRFCFDTQHAFASGMSHLETFDQIEILINSFNEFLPKRFALIHLNDSLVKFDSRVDRHARIGRGEIWKDNLQNEGLMTLLSTSITNGIPLIVENGMGAEDVKLLLETYAQG